MRHRGPAVPCLTLSSLLVVLFVFNFVLFAVAPASAGGPMETVPARPVEKGALEWRLGAEFQEGHILPFDTVKSDRELLRLPTLSAALGVSERVEVRLYYDWLHLDEGLGSDESGSGDLRIATKIGITNGSGNLPALSVLFGTKLPNANLRDRLGTDETDFFATFLASGALGPAAVHLNVGIALLGDPQPSGGQDDVLTYGVAVELPMDPFQLTLEINGQADSRENNDRTVARATLHWRVTDWASLDAGAGVGLNDESEDFIATGGITFYSDLF